jgi:hypothetical protein
MTETFVCRSPAEIQDDDVTNTHSECVRMLADWVYAGVYSGYTYTGSKRRSIESIKVRCEAVMLGEKGYNKCFQHGAGFELYWVIASKP